MTCLSTHIILIKVEDRCMHASCGGLEIVDNRSPDNRIFSVLYYMVAMSMIK